ncbi:M20/M25/M40 family metallo-hydrolase [Candidatus Uhrbacteria bacterium]|nr:M20/M25/M40 family metallo-hydrolase [Candidatus Uhrbacteria bacterium]
MDKAVEILREIVRIPSFVGNGQDESAMADAVREMLRDLGGRWKVTEQAVEGRRRNVFVSNSPDPKLLFLAHMDTVPPSAAWSRDPFAAEIEGGRLYGLGAVDMKAGLAAIVDALTERKDTAVPTAALFYVGEEYDFCGMRRFIAESRLAPETVIVPEPTDLKVYQGCRAVIGGVMTVIGRTGHSAMSRGTVNAITAGFRALSALERRLAEERDDRLGTSSLNVAGSAGGVRQDGRIAIVENMVPDFARFNFSVRASTPSAADLSLITKVVGRELEGCGAKLESCDCLGTGVMKSTGRFAGFPEFERGDESAFGYTDSEMLVSAFGGNPVVCGPGPMGMAHCPDEYVDLDEFGRMTDELRKML